MPEGEILYINSVGGFRTRTVKLDPTLPIVVKNHRDHQAHALDEKPVYGVLKPVRFDSVSELLAADAPADPLIVKKWGIVCADNAVWPLSPQSLDQYVSAHVGAIDDEGGDGADALGEPRSLDDLRQLKYQEYCEEATQRAMHEAEKADSKDGYLTAVSFTFGLVACAVLILVAGVIAYYKWGPDGSGEAVPAPSPEAAALYLLPVLGLMGLGRRKRPAVEGEAPGAFRDRKPEKTPKPEKARKPKIGKGDAWVTATVFDHALLGGKIWQAQLLYSTWIGDPSITEACIFRPDLPWMRKFGAVIGCAIGAGACFSIGYASPLHLVAGIAGLFIGAPLGALFGWFLGPQIMGSKPRIMVARIPDDNNTRQLVPIEHNYCRTVSVGDYLDNLEAVLARLNAGSGDDEDEAYEPTVFRATTFYDDLAARDETAEVSSPSETLHKVQIGMMALMAFGSVGLLFFVAMATTGG